MLCESIVLVLQHGLFSPQIFTFRTHCQDYVFERLDLATVAHLHMSLKAKHTRAVCWVLLWTMLGFWNRFLIIFLEFQITLLFLVRVTKKHATFCVGEDAQ